MTDVTPCTLNQHPSSLTCIKSGTSQILHDWTAYFALIPTIHNASVLLIIKTVLTVVTYVFCGFLPFCQHCSCAVIWEDVCQQICNIVLGFIFVQWKSFANVMCVINVSVWWMKPGRKLSYTKLSCLADWKGPVQAMITFVFLYPLPNSLAGLADHEQAYLAYL